MILMTMSKNPALLQKILKVWLRLQESQESFAGLESGGSLGSLNPMSKRGKKESPYLYGVSLSEIRKSSFILKHISFKPLKHWLLETLPVSSSQEGNRYGSF